MGRDAVLGANVPDGARAAMCARSACVWSGDLRETGEDQRAFVLRATE